MMMFPGSSNCSLRWKQAMYYANDTVDDGDAYNSSEAIYMPI